MLSRDVKEDFDIKTLEALLNLAEGCLTNDSINMKIVSEELEKSLDF